ncbi:MAG TPA: hypothetical protein VGP85_07600 [Pyrinomonadaceae bacterium]|jgi:uncharacterized protein YoxC|nr:hypothetical protein [Pyrinomonadaceae bacterium]
MTNNEYFERKMNFILEKQAQFAADMQRLEESQARTDQVVAEMGEAVTQAVSQVGDVVTRLANVTHAGFTDVNAKIDALVDAQIRSEERLARNEEKSVRTDEKIARAEESIQRLSDTVDRYIRERRNGH